MYAHLRALVCLISVIVPVSAASPEMSAAAGPDVEVYLKTSPADPANILDSMRQELVALMLRAGIHVNFHSAGAGGPAAERLVMVELRGTCHTPPPEATAEPFRGTLALASTTISDGKVLPFSFVDCSALNRFLGPALLNQDEAVKDLLYGRAMARVLAHECYHVLTQTEDHPLAGLAKARLSTEDLLADRLDFDTVAIGKLHLDSAPAEARYSGADDIGAVGR